MKRKWPVLLCLALVVLNIGFIWGNSILPGEDSRVVSGKAMGLVAWFIDLAPMKALGLWLTDLSNGYFGTAIPRGESGMYLLRKLAHFCEFGLLGMNLGLLFSVVDRRLLHRLTLPLLAGTWVAAIDETIQIFVPGRSGSLFDMWVDIFGLTLGIFALALGYYFLEKICCKHQK